MTEPPTITVPHPPRVLVVDDDPAVRDALARALRLERLDVAIAVDGQDALDQISEVRFDAIILDVSMPRLDGLEVCRRLRHVGERTPVLILTARDEVDDRVEGLDAGADDYLAKPFALKELKARLRALLRRLDPPSAQVPEPLVYDDLHLDPVGHVVTRGELRLDLTKTEFVLLRFFLMHPGQVLTRPQIFDAVWGYDFGVTSNALGVYIGYLRRKTEAGGGIRLLHTVRGIGYVLRREP